MLVIFSCFIRDESGATGLEYALIAAMVSIMLVSGASAIGASVARRYAAMAAGLP